MFVLDTNVLSELMRPAPAPAVANWVGRQTRSALFTTTITEAEIFYGIELMPDGHRRQAVLTAAERMFAEEFDGRVLSFDRHAARFYALAAAQRRRSGFAVGPADVQIAAIAAACEATVVTRNVADFQYCGVVTLNPWTYEL
jgi:predicted nucleic acid-binding protein